MVYNGLEFYRWVVCNFLVYTVCTYNFVKSRKYYGNLYNFIDFRSLTLKYTFKFWISSSSVSVVEIINRPKSNYFKQNHENVFEYLMKWILSIIRKFFHVLRKQCSKWDFDNKFFWASNNIFIDAEGFIGESRIRAYISVQILHLRGNQDCAIHDLSNADFVVSFKCYVAVLGITINTRFHLVFNYSCHHVVNYETICTLLICFEWVIFNST